MPVEQECTEQVGTKTTVNKFIGCCGGTVHSGRTELSPHCGLWHLGPMVEAGCDEGQDRLAACPHTTGSLLLASKKALFLDCYLEPFSCDKSGYS